MKACPFCAEEIQDAAIKCKHCGEMLGVLPVSVQPSRAVEKRKKPAVQADLLVDSRIAQTNTKVERIWSGPIKQSHGCATWMGGALAFVTGFSIATAAGAGQNAPAIGLVFAIPVMVHFMMKPDPEPLPSYVKQASADCPRCGTHVAVNSLPGIGKADFSAVTCIRCRTLLDLTGDNAVRAETGPDPEIIENEDSSAAEVVDDPDFDAGAAQQAAQKIGIAPQSSSLQ